MEHSESFFTSLRNYKIYYQSWRPGESVKPKAVLQIAHGIGEHSGRYLNVVKELVPEGFIVYANDHYGHGKSDGQRVYTPSLLYYIEDMYELTTIIQEKEKDLPIFLLGHSLGSLIATFYAEKYQEPLKGLVLSGAGTKNYGGSAWILRQITMILSWIIPRKHFKSNLPIEKISHDQEVRRKYLEDPLNSPNLATFRVAYEMMGWWAKTKKAASMIKIPVLLQKGSEDVVVLDEEGLFNSFTTEDKTLKVYEGRVHEIYNETIELRKEPLTDLHKWLENHI